MTDDFFEDGKAEEAGSPFDLRELVLYGIGRLRWIVVTGLVVGLLGGLVAGFSKPNVYMSLGKMLFLPGSRETQMPEEFLSADGEVQRARTGIADELQFLDNPTVHRRVAERVGVKRLLTPPDPMQMDSPSTFAPIRLIHRAQRWWFRRGSAVDSANFDPTTPQAIEYAAKVADASLAMVNEKGTNYINFYTNASSPQLAQELCEAYLDESRQWHREFFSRPEGESLVRSQLESVIDRSRRAQGSYNEHRLQCGQMDIAAQKGALQIEVLSLEGQIAALESSISGRAVELDGIEGELEKVDRWIVQTIPAKLKLNPDHERYTKRIEFLEQDLIALANEYPATSTVYRDNERRIREQIAEFQTKRSALDEFLVAEPEHEETVESARFLKLSDRFTELQRERERALVELDGLRERLVVVTEDRDRVLECEPIHAELEREIARAREREDQLRSTNSRFEAMKMLESEENMQSLRVVQEANFDARKIAPSRTKMFLGGVVGGLALAIVLAILRQLLDGRVRYPRGTEKTLGIPVLGVIDESTDWRRGTRAS